MNTYNQYEDAGHSWLEVPMIELGWLGIADKISQYSYRKGKMAYLEEDSDWVKFHMALKEKGYDYKVKRIFHDESPVRGYKSYV